MESTKERIKREYAVAAKMLPMKDPAQLKKMQDEKLDTAAAWIRVARKLGRPLSTREQECLNI